MRNNQIVLAVLLSFLFLQIQAQESENSPLITFIYLESGDVLVGDITIESDTTFEVKEINLGPIIVHQQDIKKTETIYRNSLIQISLSDNSKYSGTLIDVEESNYVIKNVFAGEVRIPQKKVTAIVNMNNRRMVTANPNSTRYFFAPSAIPIKKNSGYYQNAYLLANSVNFGISNNFSLGGGVVIPLLFFATPKVSFEVRKNLYIGAGLLAASTFIPGEVMSGAIPFGLVTVGSSENNITIGSGYGFLWVDGNYEHTTYPITVLNGMMRISNRIQLVSENWIIPFQKHYYMYGYQDVYGNYIDDEKLNETYDVVFMALSVGMRIRTGERSTVDFSPVYLYGEESIVIPYLDFVYKF